MNTYLPPDTLLQNGRYKIVRFISSGGFGCTYEAVHVKLGKRVAIKEFFVKDFCNRDENTAQVSVGTSSKKGLVKRLSEKFCEEAQALSELNHPGIVRVTDVFDENGTSYFVMDYVDGKSLNDIVKTRGPLSEDLAVQFIRQVSTALRYVHKHNRLHLDIKPGNIMVNTEGKAILIDFGASKQYDEVGGENTSTLLGKTPGYAPIEQMGNDVIQFHPSTDIYALGATLYKLLTAKTPISATRRVSGDDLEPLPPEVTPPVRQAIEAAMELNKKNRPQSVDEFLTILDGHESEGHNAEAFIRDVVNVPDQHANTQNDDSNPSDSDQANIPYYEEEEPKTNNIKKFMPLGIIAILLLVVIIVGMKFVGATAPETNDADTTKVLATEHQVTDTVIDLGNGVELTYTGMVNTDGKPTGKGRGLYKAKDYEATYTGEYVDGLREGHGVYVIKPTNGSENVFEGTFNNDLYKNGKLVDKSTGSYFKGDFKDEAPYNGKCYTKYNVEQSKVVNGVIK